MEGFLQSCRPDSPKAATPPQDLAFLHHVATSDSSRQLLPTIAVCFHIQNAVLLSHCLEVGLRSQYFEYVVLWDIFVL